MNLDTKMAEAIAASIRLGEAIFVFPRCHGFTQAEAVAALERVAPSGTRCTGRGAADVTVNGSTENDEAWAVTVAPGDPG